MKKATKPAAKLVVLENDDLISSETAEIQERIRERAYELSQQRGHSGREVDDWLVAESEIISVPPAELIEKDGTFQVRVGIPVINLEDMRVLASADQILVRGDYRHEREPGIVHLSDFKSATLFRSVRFPQPINVSTLDVELQNGVLNITASKAEAPETAAVTKRTGARKAPARKKKAS